MRSKEQVLGYVNKAAFKAMDEYAKEISIEFAKWIRENYEPEFVNGEYWVDLLDDNEAKKPYSEIELFELFIKENKV